MSGVASAAVHAVIGLFCHWPILPSVSCVDDLYVHLLTVTSRQIKCSKERAGSELASREVGSDERSPCGFPTQIPGWDEDDRKDDMQHLVQHRNEQRPRHMEAFLRQPRWERSCA
ncbi:hypothetical protein BD410DRAFT_780674 [Rickenella mellea]|uniref:Uncharacterized protein n=1 Tax=Rickenella mellea TaxID=50990 RepID=A0A4R5XIH6_9AGAM|nr:hypothetical protein BD410DRAFT_780674 [Rickenella mellea]